MDFQKMCQRLSMMPMSDGGWSCDWCPGMLLSGQTPLSLLEAIDILVDGITLSGSDPFGRHNAVPNDAVYARRGGSLFVPSCQQDLISYCLSGRLFDGRRRIIVVSDIDLIQQAQQNALCKVFDDNVDQAFYVCSCMNMNRVHQSIQSRFMHLRVRTDYSTFISTTGEIFHFRPLFDRVMVDLGSNADSELVRAVIKKFAEADHCMRVVELQKPCANDLSSYRSLLMNELMDDVNKLRQSF